MAPKSAEQFDLMKKNAKEKIQKSAVYLFSRNGLSVKISEIAKHANISQGLLYRYYASKTELITDLVITASKIAVESISGIAKFDMPAKEKINIISEAMITMLKPNGQGAETFLFMVQVYLNMGEELSKIYNWESSPIVFLSDIIAQGQKEGTIKEGNQSKLSMLYWAAVQGLCCYWALNITEFPESGMLSGILLKKEN